MFSLCSLILTFLLSKKIRKSVQQSIQQLANKSVHKSVQKSVQKSVKNLSKTLFDKHKAKWGGRGKLTLKVSNNNNKITNVLRSLLTLKNYAPLYFSLSLEFLEPEKSEEEKEEGKW